MIFRLGELFCGPGGLAWGATHADIGISKLSTLGQMTMMKIHVKHIGAISVLISLALYTMLMYGN